MLLINCLGCGVSGAKIVALNLLARMPAKHAGVIYAFIPTSLAQYDLNRDPSLRTVVIPEKIFGLSTRLAGELLILLFSTIIRAKAYLNLSSYSFCRRSCRSVTYLQDPRVIGELEESGILRAIRSLLVRPLFRSCLKKSIIVVQTNHMKNQVDRECLRQNLKAPVIKVISPGLSQEVIKQINAHKSNEQMWPDKNGTLSILYPVKNFPHKQIGLAIDFIMKLNTEGIRSKLILTVDAGEEIANVSRERKEYMIENGYVQFIGFIEQSELLPYFHDVNLVAFFSKAETFGLPLIESIVLHTPALAPNLPYAREIISDPYFLYAPFLYESFKEKLIQYMNNRQEFLGRFRELHFSIVSKYGDWDRTVDAVLDCFSTGERTRDLSVQ